MCQILALPLKHYEMHIRAIKAGAVGYFLERSRALVAGHNLRMGSGFKDYISLCTASSDQKGDAAAEYPGKVCEDRSDAHVRASPDRRRSITTMGIYDEDIIKSRKLAKEG